MWPKNYKDYPPDTPIIHYPVEPGKGITGCEMHEINGWGDHVHYPIQRQRRRKGVIAKLLAYLFGTEKETLGDR